MKEPSEPSFEADKNDIKLLVDTLRQCFGAAKARYHINEGTLTIEISGLETLNEEKITEVAEPVLEELDTGFDEIVLLGL